MQSETGFLHYLDVSIGEMVTSLKTHMGRLSVLAQRPASGVVALGHPTGTVSLWTPSERRPVLKLLTHNGAVRALAADHTDKCAATQLLQLQLVLLYLLFCFSCTSFAILDRM